ncbi:MAG: ABC transporter substrate-binding protein, partial [Phenylobacterium sp.]
LNSLADIKGRPILLSDASTTAFWVWLRAKYGYTDEQVRKYNFNPAPFLADKRVVQQGYLTSEPYTIKKVAGFDPQVFLLADEGFPGYAAMVLAPDSLIAGNPQAVKAFNEASAAGWRSYLFGDAAPGDALIIKDNPEITPDILQQARAKMRAYAIVGEPIGAMTDERWKTFFDVAASQGVYAKDLDYKSAYTLALLPGVK